MKKVTKLLAVIVLGLSVCSNLYGCGSNKETKAAAENTQKSDYSDKLIVAHRGASGYLPEHTLEAYSMAYALGADYIEADVNITKDGVPVVMHDIYLDTDTDVEKVFPDRKRADGRYYIVDFTVSEIKQLTISERVSEKTKEAVYPDRFPVGKSHFEVPTLAEEIELIQGLNKSTGRDVGIYPELKFPVFYKESGFDIGKITLDCLEQYGYNKDGAKCYIQCFDAPYLKSFKERLNPKCKLVQLTGDQTWDDCKNDDIAYMLSNEGLKEVAEYADVLSPSTDEIYNEEGKMEKGGQVLNDNLVKDAHDAGLEVCPYTVRVEEVPKYAHDAEEFMRMLLFDADCDSLFTDFTDIGVKAREAGPLK